MSRFDHLPDPATALVVGASGGIGAALARALEAEGGFRVIRAARRPERCEGEALALDLEDDASWCERLRRRVAAAHRPPRPGPRRQRPAPRRSPGHPSGEAPEGPAPRRPGAPASASMQLSRPLLAT
ncbi:MAG: hypothetical protein U5R48_07885 [Gammaproteobacteria bacterium]|nr:hypothetical protein [Gammaproteobacteria bacterium]